MTPHPDGSGGQALDRAVVSESSRRRVPMPSIQTSLLTARPLWDGKTRQAMAGETAAGHQVIQITRSPDHPVHQDSVPTLDRPSQGKPPLTEPPPASWAAVHAPLTASEIRWGFRYGPEAPGAAAHGTGCGAAPG